MFFLFSPKLVADPPAFHNGFSFVVAQMEDHARMQSIEHSQYLSGCRFHRSLWSVGFSVLILSTICVWIAESESDEPRSFRPDSCGKGLSLVCFGFFSHVRVGVTEDYLPPWPTRVSKSARLRRYDLAEPNECATMRKLCEKCNLSDAERYDVRKKCEIAESLCPTVAPDPGRCTLEKGGCHEPSRQEL